MLYHIGGVEKAVTLRKSIDAALNTDNIRTRDLGGTASTSEFANAVKHRVRSRTLPGDVAELR